MFETVTIVGVGLISGSFAWSLKEKGLARKIIGVSRTPESAQKALKLGFVDEVMTLEEAVPLSDLIYVAIPVDASEKVLEKILNKMNSNQILTDAGSTKSSICRYFSDHPLRRRFVAAHPMWGTEYSGPEAAVKNAFSGKACVVCEKEKSDADALFKVEELYRTIGMHLIYMSADDHDIHAAYVSHISHITSFALANTVLEKEKEEQAIFELAAGGFESTVRLAKSNPEMWSAIFMQNRENVLDVLNEHISQLRKFKSALEKENGEFLKELMLNANRIKKIIE
jgi:prephenate dehydrogenase